MPRAGGLAPAPRQPGLREKKPAPFRCGEGKWGAANSAIKAAARPQNTHHSGRRYHVLAESKEHCWAVVATLDAAARKAREAGVTASRFEKRQRVLLRIHNSFPFHLPICSSAGGILALNLPRPNRCRAALSAGLHIAVKPPRACDGRWPPRAFIATRLPDRPDRRLTCPAPNFGLNVYAAQITAVRKDSCDVSKAKPARRHNDNNNE